MGEAGAARSFNRVRLGMRNITLVQVRLFDIFVSNYGQPYSRVPRGGRVRQGALGNH